MSTTIMNAPMSSESRSRGRILQLREWGTDQCYRLPAEALRCQIGSDSDCWVHLADPDVMPIHAQLSRGGQRWLVHALGDAPGLRQDGARNNAFALDPGVEIGLGQTTLIAEDRPWMVLRRFCARLLGWGGDRVAVVDRALRSIRMSLTHRAPLLLRGGGDGDLVPIAYALHRRTLGDDQPFIVCDPRRRDGKRSVRSAGNCRTGAAAFPMARGGTICVRSRRLPRDLATLLARVREPGVDVQIIVCTNPVDIVSWRAETIDIPSLSTRTAELSRIIDEYAQDAIAALGVSATNFTPEDHRWILERSATSLADIEKATLRTVALRASGNPTRAAALLGMAPISLSRWVGRRIPLSRSRPGNA